MNVNEIAQILKDIPNDLYKLPQYDKLFGNVKMHTFFVILDITLPTKTIAIRVEVYEDMDFSFRIYNRYIIVNHLKKRITALFMLVNNNIISFSYHLYKP